ncbi:hypothetical protein [Simiduia litorea]|uniref:hypothetical protein n=1 Tax=Simiduia litorea TaxID=1435348 RepID=UPI0036F37DCB
MPKLFWIKVPVYKAVSAKAERVLGVWRPVLVRFFSVRTNMALAECLGGTK